jgi:predicted dinucleotide-binding enzyme
MGIMGAGKIGVAFANALAKKSIRVVFSNIRDQAIQDESSISSEESIRIGTREATAYSVRA